MSIPQTLTCDYIREMGPCYDPATALGKDWQGTLLDFLDAPTVTIRDRVWVALLLPNTPFDYSKEFVRQCILELQAYTDICPAALLALANPTFATVQKAQREAKEPVERTIYHLACDLLQNERIKYIKRANVLGDFLPPETVLAIAKDIFKTQLSQDLSQAAMVATEAQ
jgi:hypothetical protein